MNLTDEQIKQALECCADCHGSDCSDCPCQSMGSNCEGVSLEALDYINRLEAENSRLLLKIKKFDEKIVIQSGLIDRQKSDIEALKAHEEKEHNYCKNICEPKHKADSERLKRLLNEADTQYNLCAKRFFTEGIKDLAERLKTRTVVVDDELYITIEETELDELVNELEGEGG